MPKKTDYTDSKTRVTAKPDEYGMTGFELKNTLSEAGGGSAVEANFLKYISGKRRVLLQSSYTGALLALLLPGCI